MVENIDKKLCAESLIHSCAYALQIEFPVAIVDKNIDKKEPQARKVAEAFVQYLFSEEAQQEFMDCGFR